MSSQQESTREKIYVFSHNPCIDGTASAWIIQDAFPDAEVIMQGLDHNLMNNAAFAPFGSGYVKPPGGDWHYDEKGDANFVVNPHGPEEIVDHVLKKKPEHVYFTQGHPYDVEIVSKLLQAGHKVTLFDSSAQADGALLALAQAYEHQLIFRPPEDGEGFEATPKEVVEQLLHKKPEQVYFLDYVPGNAKIIQKLLEDGYKVTIFDHHDTAERNLKDLQQAHEGNPNLKIVFDNTLSGAAITWREIHPDRELPGFIKFVQKMDLLDLTSKEEQQAELYVAGHAIKSLDVQENIHIFDMLMQEFEREGIKGMALKASHEYDKMWQDWKKNVTDSARIIELKGLKMTVVQSGDITLPPRGLIQEVVEELTSGEKPAALLMVDDRSPDQTVIGVRVRAADSGITSDFIEAIGSLHPSISRGGRGTQGIIGQAALRMPPEVAAELGFIGPVNKAAEPPTSITVSTAQELDAKNQGTVR